MCTRPPVAADGRAWSSHLPSPGRASAGGLPERPTWAASSGGTRVDRTNHNTQLRTSTAVQPPIPARRSLSPRPDSPLPWSQHAPTRTVRTLCSRAVRSIPQRACGRTRAKKVVTLLTNSAGCSKAAKWSAAFGFVPVDDAAESLLGPVPRGPLKLVGNTLQPAGASTWSRSSSGPSSERVTAGRSSQSTVTNDEHEAEAGAPSD